jgi:hypothetical protein
VQLSAVLIAEVGERSRAGDQTGFIVGASLRALRARRLTGLLRPRVCGIPLFRALQKCGRRFTVR